MILAYILALTATTFGAVPPVTDLLPPDFPDAGLQNPAETEDTAKLKGLYIPDNLETRFDDGSDKSPPAPVPLADSPYGPVPAGSGLEGQYITDNVEKMYDPGLYAPDNLEKKFDDGLYKNENTPEPLIESPYGLVRAGSGFEGQYTPDNLEKQFNDGQYEDHHIEKGFDDGLYKGDTTPEPNFIETPFGLVRAGTGIEGQYFDKHIEKQFDDGLYKGDVPLQNDIYDPNLSKTELNNEVYKSEDTAPTSESNLPRGLVRAGVGFIPSK